MKRALLVSLAVLGLVVAITAGVMGPRAEPRSLPWHTTGTPGSRTFEFTYSVDLQPLPQTVRRISIWIPVPRETPVQHVEGMSIETDLPQRVLTDPVYGNRFLYLETDAGPPKSRTIGLTYKIRREECRASRPAPPKLVATEAGDLARFLEPDRLVPTSGVIGTRSAQVVAGVDGEPLRKLDSCTRTCFGR